jgi:DNA repair exonuclease SbcCD ATPase subunit
MIFTYVSIKGFRSFKNKVVFDLDDTGIHQVIGKNGAGKTSLFEAMFWCLYGESLKTGSVVESQSGEPIEVSLHFVLNDNSYQVTRNSKELLLLENRVNQGLYKKDTQQRIIDVLGLTPMQFLNSVLMAQRGVRIADYSEKERREFFETLFELDWVDQLGEKVKQKSQELNTALAVQKSKLESLNRELENLRLEGGTVQQRKEVFEAEQADILVRLETEHRLCLAELRNHVNSEPQHETIDTSEYEETLEQAKKELELVKSEVNQLGTKVKLKEQELANHHRNVPKEPETTCPKCGQSTVDEQVWADLNEKYLREYATWRLVGESIMSDWPSGDIINQFSEKRSKLEYLINEYQGYIINVDRLRQEFDQKHNRWALETAKLEAKTVAAEQAVDRHKNAPKPNFVQWLADLAEKLYSAQVAIEECQNDILEIETEKVKADYWVKSLGVNALKSHITQSYFQKLNQYISYYGQLFGFGLRFSMDLSKKLTKSELEIWRLTGDSVPYGNLSGGEKARVELALQLALAKLIAPKASLIIFDESMIGLDQDGLDSIREIFTQISKDKAVYFISHLNESHLYTNTIEVVKTEDGSKIIR